MTASYRQKGEAIGFKNGTAVKVMAGEIVAFGQRVGVAGCDIPPGGTGTLHMEGVFEAGKDGTGAIAAGMEVYLSGSGITAEGAGNIPAGYAVEDSPDGAAKVTIKINA